MSILQILNELASTTSTNNKQAIILRERDNAVLRSVFAAAYNPLLTYHIKKIPDYIPRGPKSTVLLPQAITSLNSLATRNFTGNAAITFLSDILSNLSEDDATVLARIINRDLRCGCSDSIASRVWENLVPEFDVMLCDKDMSRIKYPAYAQLKCDGARVHLYYDGVNAKAMSRNGKEFNLLGALDKSAAAIMEPGECLDGELLVVKNNSVLDRKTGNGIINTLIQSNTAIAKLEEEICQLEMKLQELSITK